MSSNHKSMLIRCRWNIVLLLTYSAVKNIFHVYDLNSTTEHTWRIEIVSQLFRLLPIKWIFALFSEIASNSFEWFEWVGVISDPSAGTDVSVIHRRCLFNFLNCQTFFAATNTFVKADKFLNHLLVLLKPWMAQGLNCTGSLVLVGWKHLHQEIWAWGREMF